MAVKMASGNVLNCTLDIHHSSCYHGQTWCGCMVLIIVRFCDMQLNGVELKHIKPITATPTSFSATFLQHLVLAQAVIAETH